MKEITRIHIAKTAYDIEVAAKKDLESYMQALERYADDAEILEDIEIRITELLDERGVQKGGVISAADVASLRERLGEPQEFAEEGDVAAALVDDAEKPRRRLYRDEDQAILGGVLSGISRYFGFNPMWARIAFIILLLVSFGTAAIVYIVLWIAVPVARTAAEKLELAGKPITLAAIKQQGEAVAEAARTNNTAQTVQNILLFLVGLFFAAVAFGSLIFTAFAGAGLLFGVGTSFNSPIAEFVATSEWQLVAAYVLFVVSGLLFTALNAILAIATFSKKWTKRIGISIVAIVLSGMLAFGGGSGLVFGHAQFIREKVHAMQETTVENLTNEFKNITALKVESDDDGPAAYVSIRYVVAEQPRWEFEGLPGVVPEIEIDGTTAEIDIEFTGKEADEKSWNYGFRPTLTVYGPAVETIAIDEHSQVTYHNKQPQNSLAVTVQAGGFDLQGTYQNVTIANKNGGVVGLGDAAIQTLTVDDQGGHVSAGVVRSLAVMQPDSCRAASSYQSNLFVEVQAVSSGVMQYNGKEQAARTIENDCGTVQVGKNEKAF